MCRCHLFDFLLVNVSHQINVMQPGRHFLWCQKWSFSILNGQLSVNLVSPLGSHDDDVIMKFLDLFMGQMFGREAMDDVSRKWLICPDMNAIKFTSWVKIVNEDIQVEFFMIKHVFSRWKGGKEHAVFSGDGVPILGKFFNQRVLMKNPNFGKFLQNEDGALSWPFEMSTHFGYC